MIDEKLLNTKEFAKLVNVSDSTVRHWIRQGFIEARRGNKGKKFIYLIDICELEKVKKD